MTSPRTPDRPTTRVAALLTTLLTALLTALLIALGTVVLDAPATEASEGSEVSEAAGPDPSRLSDIVRTLVEGRIYLEPSLGGGAAQSWVPRLQRAADAAGVPGGVAIAGWVDVPGSTPELEELGADVVEAYVAAGGRASVIATSGGSSFDLQPRPGVRRPLLTRVLRTLERGRAVGTEATRRYSAELGLGQRPAGGVEKVRLHETAQLWISLRLLAPDGPSPDALASQVAGDPTSFVDNSTYASYPGFPSGVRDDPTRRGSSLAALAVVVGLYLVVTAVRAWRGSRRRRRDEQAEAGGHRFASAAEVEEAVTRLAEELARVPVRLDDLGYRRAQRCRDAAERYVDRDSERDRVGVLLLSRDGLVWLGGAEPEPRCFFDPRHEAGDGLVAVGGSSPEGAPTVRAVEDLDAEVPCCRRCASHLADGDEPAALRVTGDDAGAEGGPRRPYHEVDDSWTRTGYGSLSPEWAQQVLDESWTRVGREER